MGRRCREGKTKAGENLKVAAVEEKRRKEKRERTKRERERGREKGSSCNIIVSTCTLFAFLSAAEFNAAVYSAVFEDGRMKGEGRERERERERKGEREKERERTEGENG